MLPERTTVPLTRTRSYHSFVANVGRDVWSVDKALAQPSTLALVTFWGCMLINLGLAIQQYPRRSLAVPRCAPMQTLSWIPPIALVLILLGSLRRHSFRRRRIRPPSDKQPLHYTTAGRKPLTEGSPPHRMILHQIFRLYWKCSTPPRSSFDIGPCITIDQKTRRRQESTSRACRRVEPRRTTLHQMLFPLYSTFPTSPTPPIFPPTSPPSLLSIKSQDDARRVPTELADGWDH
ncbi:hypothetical protein HD554DRAFT_2052274 [Boletus coccyginus]|nr:hypothetical protein HD554DRAFT_2052274 [Boletus coccyginus]